MVKLEGIVKRNLLSIISFYDILKTKKTKGEKEMELFNIICGYIQ